MSKKSNPQGDKNDIKIAKAASADRINRARSVTVGTAFNGVTEITLRADNKYIWAILQPVEVIEIIHQLAASVGCHIHLQPRNDFASWRQWRTGDQESGVNFPPFSNTTPTAIESSSTNYVQSALTQQEASDGETVAIEAPEHGRVPK